jgi:hypothetical protein
MIFQHTIQHQEPKEFDKLCGKFLNEQGDSIISVDYCSNAVPVQATPVNIPGFQQQQMQMQFITFFFAFFRYTVAKPEDAAGKIVTLKN